MKKLCFLSAFSLLSLCAGAAIYTVTSNVDGTTSDGVSLRWAITQANGGAQGDTIRFNIPGMAPQVILVNTALPNVMDNAIYINGLSQPANGYGGPEPKIVIRNNASITNGLYFFATQNARIDGIWIRNFTSYGIYLFGSNAFVDVNQCKLSHNGQYGFYEVGSVANCYIHNSTISNNTSDGIYIFGASAKGKIQGNLVSGNGARGIVINSGSDSCFIRGNRVGTDSTGKLPFPNTTVGIYTGNSNNRIGGMNNGEGNTVAYNGGDGIQVAIGNHNLIARNSLFCNGGQGINLTSGGNNNFAMPVITLANVNGLTGTSTANARIEVFYDTSCTGCEGKNYISTTYANSSGQWNLVAALQLGSSVTATAADTANNNTSKFAACVTVITVSVPELQNLLSVSVHPNPFADDFTVANLRGRCGMWLYNVVGELLWTRQTESEKYIFDSELSPGIYFLKIISGEEIRTLKLVKE